MLAVKDFKKGQKAYIVTDDYGTRENCWTVLFKERIFG